MEAKDNTIPVLDKALELLELMAACNDGLRQTEICARLGLSTSTAYRMLRTFIARNWLVKKKSGKIVLGNGMMPLFASFRDSGRRIASARKAVHSLAEKVDMACKLSIRRGAEQVTIERAEPVGPYSLVSAVNSSFPVIEGSVGAALLADESNEEVLRLAAVCNMDLPEKRDPSMVLKGIDAVRRKGYVLNTSPNRWNVAAMSVPLRDEYGAVLGAMTVVGTRLDFAGRKKDKLASCLIKTVEEIQ